MPGFWICFWFSIYHSFKDVRVAQGSKYVWLCLIMSDYVIPYLKEPYTDFLESKNLIFFFSIFFFFSLSIWFCFLFSDWIFLQVRFQTCCYLWGPKWPGALNLTQPVRYPINISMMLFQWFIHLFCCCCCFTFWHVKDLIED